MKWCALKFIYVQCLNSRSQSQLSVYKKLFNVNHVVMTRIIINDLSVCCYIRYLTTWTTVPQYRKWQNSDLSQFCAIEKAMAVVLALLVFLMCFCAMYVRIRIVSVCNWVHLLE